SIVPSADLKLPACGRLRNAAKAATDSVIANSCDGVFCFGSGPPDRTDPRDLIGQLAPALPSAKAPRTFSVGPRLLAKEGVPCPTHRSISRPRTPRRLSALRPSPIAGKRCRLLQRNPITNSYRYVLHSGRIERTRPDGCHEQSEHRQCPWRRCRRGRCRRAPCRPAERTLRPAAGP